MSGKEIGAAGGDFDFRIGLAFEGVLNKETGGSEMALDLAAMEEIEMEIGLDAPELLHMLLVETDVKRKKEQAARSQDSVELAKQAGEFRSRDMNDGVEGDDSGEGMVAGVEGEHVALTEIDLGIQSAGLIDHGWGEVDAEDIDTALVKIACDVTWAAAEIADLANSFQSGGEVIEEFAIETLAGKFVVKTTRVFGREGIIAGLNGSQVVGVHRLELYKNLRGSG